MLAIFLGAGFGALGRYGLQLGFLKICPSLPVGTLVANLVGCFLIGLCHSWLLGASEYWRLGIVTGFLGALTTFSSYALDLNLLAVHKNWLGLVIILLGTLIGGLLLACLGMKISQTLAL